MQSLRYSDDVTLQAIFKWQRIIDHVGSNTQGTKHRYSVHINIVEPRLTAPAQRLVDDGGNSAGRRSKCDIQQVCRCVGFCERGEDWPELTTHSGLHEMRLWKRRGLQTAMPFAPELTGCATAQPPINDRRDLVP